METDAGESEMTVESERLRQLDLVYTGVVGMLVAVAWSYLLVEELDPKGECPGPARCWPLNAVLFVSVVLGTFFWPYVALEAARYLRPRAESLGAPLMSRRGFGSAFARRLQRLATDTTGTAWSVSISTLIYYVLGQVETGYVTPSQGGGERGGAGHANASIVAILVAGCSAVLLLLLGLTLLGTRRLPRETRPYWVEVWLMLARSTSYPSGYAFSIAIGLAFFTGYQVAAIRSKWLSFAVAIVRAIVYWIAMRFVARLLPKVHGDRSVALADASESVVKTAKLWVSTSCGVVACIGVNDAVVDLADNIWGSKVWPRVAFYLVGWAPTLLAVAVLRSRARLKRLQDQPEQATGRCALLFSTFHPNDAAFVDVAELWLVAFAYWTPYKLILTEVWNFTALFTGTSNSVIITLLLGIAHFIWLLIVAAVLTVLSALFVAALVVLADAVSTCLSPREPPSTTPTPPPPLES